MWSSLNPNSIYFWREVNLGLDWVVSAILLSVLQQQLSLSHKINRSLFNQGIVRRPRGQLAIDREALIGFSWTFDEWEPSTGQLTTPFPNRSPICELIEKTIEDSTICRSYAYTLKTNFDWPQHYCTSSVGNNTWYLNSSHRKVSHFFSCIELLKDKSKLYSV